MKFVIIEDKKLTEVSEITYDEWMEKKGNKYILPAYTSKNHNVIHTIDTDFAGAFDDNEDIKPFILFHFEHRVISGNEGSVKHLSADTEYFENFEEMQKRRYDLISEIASVK